MIYVELNIDSFFKIDVYLVANEDGEEMILKLHRLVN